MIRKQVLPPGQPGPARALLLRMRRASMWVRTSRANGQSMVNEDGIMLLVLIIVVGFSTAVVYHYIMGYYLGKPWPANTFLHSPDVQARFYDFLLVVRQSANLDPFGEDIGGFAGSPFGQLVGYLFSLIHPAFLRLPIFLGSFFIAFTAIVNHYLSGLKSWPAYRYALAVFAIVFLTYPVLFAVDRANMDLLVVPCLFLFAHTYEKGRWKTSTLFLALSIALKPYTAIFTVVYLFDRRFRDGLLVIFNAALLTILSLSIFKDGLLVETHKYLNALTNAADYLSVGNQQVFTSDLYTLLTIIARAIGDLLNAQTYLPEHAAFRIAYPVLAGIAAIYFIVHLWKQPQPLWKTMAVLTILVVLLPINTHDYRLTYLFVPMLIYLASGDRPRHAILIVILWGLLLVPKNYCALWEPPQNIGMVINPLLLIGLLISIIPDAFSMGGPVSASRFLCARLHSTWPARKLENARSN